MDKEKVSDLEGEVGDVISSGNLMCPETGKGFRSEVRRSAEPGAFEVYCPYCKEKHYIPRRFGNY